MKYPTMEEVEAADRTQLCRWHRFLPSPGIWAIDRGDFHEVMEREATISDRIEDRFREAGGFTPEISKQIGWE